MNVALSRGEPLCHGTYLDDCTVGGEDADSCWVATLEAMKRLLRVGLPLNVRKLKLLQQEVPILGLVLAEDQF